MKDPENLRPSHPDQTVILLVEDEVMIQNIVRITLEGEGYFVLTAHDGQEALELSRNYPGPIHLLLTDIMMPRMDGIQLSGNIRRERPATAVLVMSGTHHPGTTARYLAKPFTTVSLREAVREVLSERALSRVLEE